MKYNTVLTVLVALGCFTTTLADESPRLFCQIGSQIRYGVEGGSGGLAVWTLRVDEAKFSVKAVATLLTGLTLVIQNRVTGLYVDLTASTSSVSKGLAETLSLDVWITNMGPEANSFPVYCLFRTMP